MATIRRVALRDLGGMQRVCLLTGNSGGDASELHADPDLMGHIWVTPYVLFPDAVGYVVHDEQGVAGYTVGVPDTRAFEDWIEREWLPPLHEDHPRGSGATPADRALVERLYAWPRTESAVADDFPAHLHIDLLPRLQGQGMGRVLITRLLDGLAAAGAHGVHLGVAATNTGALAFYERIGFENLGPDPDDPGYVLGMTLPAQA